MIGDNWQTLADDLWDLKVQQDQLKIAREQVMAKKRGLVKYVIQKGASELNGLGTDSRFGLKLHVKHTQPSTMSILEPVLVDFMTAHDNRLPSAKELKAALKQKKLEMRGPPQYDLRWFDAQADTQKKANKLRKVLADNGFSEHARIVDDGMPAPANSGSGREAARPVSL